MNRLTLPDFARAAVILRPSAEFAVPDDSPVTFGGRPQLPEGMSWPRGRENRPMVFFAQVNLDALPREYSVDEGVFQMPKRPGGTLFVFLALYGDDIPDALSERFDCQPTCVLHHPASVNELPFRDPPEDVVSLLGEDSHWVSDCGVSACGRMLRRQGGEMRPYLSARSENALFRNMSREAGADDLAARDFASALQAKTLRDALSGPEVKEHEVFFHFPWLRELYIEIENYENFFNEPLTSYTGIMEQIGPTLYGLRRKLGLIKPKFPTSSAPVPEGFPWRWSLVSGIVEKIAKLGAERFDATFSISRGNTPAHVFLFREARAEAAEWLERAREKSGTISERDGKEFRDWLKKLSTTHLRIKPLRKPDPTVVDFCARQLGLLKRRQFLGVVQSEDFAGWDTPVSEDDKAVAEIIDRIALVDAYEVPTLPYFGHMEAQKMMELLTDIIWTETMSFIFKLWREPETDDVPAYFYDACRAYILSQTTRSAKEPEQNDEDGSICNFGEDHFAPLQMFGAGHLIQHAADHHADDVLLMQIPSGFGTPVVIGEAGLIQIWITHDDLAAGRFDRIVTTSECL